MNSMTRHDCNQNCKEKHEVFSCHPIPGDAILRTNAGNLGPSTIVLAVGTTTPVNQPIANVAIDTTNLRDPNILVDFAGILTSSALAAAALTFNFTLFKTCSTTGVSLPVRTFSLSQLIALAFPDSRTLKLEYSSCDDSCDQCCQYTLELTSITAAVAVTLTYSIVGTISVLAVGSDC